MFVNAFAEAAEYTRPVVITKSFYDGRIGTFLGTFVVLNDDGWIATAGHILQAIRQRTIDELSIIQYDGAVAKIKASAGNAKQRNQQLRKWKSNKDWLVDVASWFGETGTAVADMHIYPEIDLGIAKLTGLSKPASFPTFKDPTNLPVARSLIRIGYPFRSVGGTYDAAAKQFKLDPADLNPPLFPIEGIHTRVHGDGQTPLGFPIRFVETSSPGLMGQSGGPILDSDGYVWGIQSTTNHYPLGFVGDGSKPITEQYLNVGLGVHPAALRAAFDHNNIAVTWSAP